MAKILTTAIVADIRNKLNGSVFSKNRYGAYIRTKVTPVNPQTTAQQNIRSIMASLSQAWRTLEETERQTWIDAAPNFPMRDIFGNSKILSGSTLYQKLNNNLLQAGETALNTAPTPAELPAITLISLTAAAGTPALSLAFSPSPVPDGVSFVIEATGNVPPGISFVKNKFRRIGIIEAAGTTPDNILAIWETVHGVPVEGQKIYVRVKALATNTGQTGVPSQIMAIVAA